MNNDRYKFRVWDEKNKCRCGNCVLDQSGTLVWCENIDYTIEQCTGIRDIHGELIYEGDIVVQPDEYPYFDYAEGVEHKDLRETLCKIEHDSVPNYIGIVEWADEDAQFVIVLQCVNPSKSGISDGVCHNFSDDENLEIIGNIHEEGWKNG